MSKKLGRTLLLYSQCLMAHVQSELESSNGTPSRTYVPTQMFDSTPAMRELSKQITGYINEILVGDAPETIVSQETLDQLSQLMELEEPLDHITFAYLLQEVVNHNHFPAIRVIAQNMVGEEYSQFEYAMDIVHATQETHKKSGLIEALEVLVHQFIEGVGENWLRKTAIAVYNKDKKK